MKLEKKFEQGVLERLKKIVSKSAQIANIAQSMGENIDLTAEGLDTIGKNLIEIIKERNALGTLLALIEITEGK